MELVVQAARALAFALLLLGCLHCCGLCTCSSRRGREDRCDGFEPFDAALVLVCAALDVLSLAPPASLQSALKAILHADAAVSRTGALWPTGPLRRRIHCASGALAGRATSDSSCMGQRLSSNTMAANAEKVATNTTGEEKTFVCAVSTGS